MRRPAANAQKWRLDRLLQRKAQEGVKIYVIIYQNVGATVPIDSTHTKYSLLGLHPNIFVQRSPRHVGGLTGQNVFFWAHHEKIISIDHTVGFVGGLDMCFGRWDSPEHVLVDDKPSGFNEGMEGKTIEDPQVWPGKDYSNPRIHDFFELDKPYDDMYDRKQTPRMPWHDVSMQLTGQPARDIARHFVQRWNYLLRTKPPSKPTPILLPPPEFTKAELESLNLNGTCELQIVRSCGPWSMGLQEKTEHSIQNAYLKCIEQSEHFVYIENQFFITSCECDGTQIENAIGDALVNRIIRAHKEGTEWRAVILLPLMPGFQNTIDSPDGSSLRLIMYAQYYSLCRGDTSIFAKLKRAGLEPEDYISVYGLRGWGKIGDQHQLVTEQVYIHAKIMIVDDRVAIIGSANINERSMRGNRDSEVAAVIRDAEQYEVMMAGKPFMVGKFAHTLRMRLQLEHLGVNSDDFEQRTMMMDGLARAAAHKIHSWDQKPPEKPSVDAETDSPKVTAKARAKSESRPAARHMNTHSFNHDLSALDEENYHIHDNVSDSDSEGESPNDDKRSWRDKFHKNRSLTSSPDLMDRAKLGQPTVTMSANPLPGAIPPNMAGAGTTALDRAEELEQGKRDPDVAVRSPESPGAISDETLSESPPDHKSQPNGHREEKLGVHHGDGTSTLPKLPKISRVTDRPVPVVDPFNVVDPLGETFFFDEWDAVARHNTEVYRRLFRPMPDNEVKTWTEYKEFFAYSERLAKAQGQEKGKMREQTDQSGASGPVGAVSASAMLKAVGKKEHNDRDLIKEYAQGGEDIEKAETERIKEELKETSAEMKAEKKELQDGVNSEEKKIKGEAKKVTHELEEVLDRKTSEGSETVAARRRRSKSLSTRAGQFSILPRETMEELLCEVQGHIVEWPMDWLVKEDANGNFLYNIDKYDSDIYGMLTL
jgi:phospholipase D1/2